MPGTGQQIGSGAATGAAIGSIIPGIGTGIGALIGGGLGLISGLSQKSKAKKALDKLQYPTEQMPEEYTRNQQMAEQMATQGLPSEQYNQAMRNIQRQQLMALRGANDRRGGLMAIGGIQQAGNDALLNLDVANAQQRIANKHTLMNVNNQIGGVKRDLYDKNIRNKYDRDWNYNMQLLGMGNQNLIGGIDQAASGLGYLAQSGLFGNGSGSGNNGTVNNTGTTIPRNTRFNQYGSTG